jgi:enamine deaminase RidA (YjgF/YER057c/UK114 family)
VSRRGGSAAPVARSVQREAPGGRSACTCLPSAFGKGDFEVQARQALANLALVLKNAGSGLDRVVKATVFVTDIARHQEAFARLRAEYFVPHTFAESFVEVSSLADPEWLIEIEAVAVAG